MRDPRLAPFRPAAAVFAAYLAVLAVSAAVLFVLKLGPTPAAVRDFYLGSEAAFTGPRSLAGLLEVAIPHLLAIPLTVFVAAHLVAFAALLRRKVFGVLCAASFGSALAGLAAGFGVRFLWPGLAPLKLAAFAAFELTLLLWIALLAGVFWPERVRASAPATPPSNEAIGSPARRSAR